MANKQSSNTKGNIKAFSDFKTYVTVVDVSSKSDSKKYKDSVLFNMTAKQLFEFMQKHFTAKQQKEATTVTVTSSAYSTAKLNDFIKDYAKELDDPKAEIEALRKTYDDVNDKDKAKYIKENCKGFNTKRLELNIAGSDSSKEITKRGLNLSKIRTIIMRNAFPEYSED